MLRNYVNPKLISKPNIKACIHSFYLKRGSASGGREEGRAPSTAEEFTRQSVASQTVEKKAYDGTAAAANVSGDSKVETEKVKEKFKKKKETEDYHKKGNDDDGLPIYTFKGT